MSNTEEHRSQKFPIINAVLLGMLNLICITLLFVAQEVWQTVQKIEVGLYKQATSIALVERDLQNERQRLNRHIEDSERHNRK